MRPRPTPLTQTIQTRSHASSASGRPARKRRLELREVGLVDVAVEVGLQRASARRRRVRLVQARGERLQSALWGRALRFPQRAAHAYLAVSNNDKPALRLCFDDGPNLRQTFQASGNGGGFQPQENDTV